MSTHPKKAPGAYGMYGRYIPLYLELRVLGWALRFGFEFSEARTDTPYLDRWIIYLGWVTLRLHRFHRGDDDRAPHNHPWWFITFPLSSYYEKVPCGEDDCFPHALKIRLVQRFRFHFRPAGFQHIVVGRKYYKDAMKPIYTIVLSGASKHPWGFWPMEDGEPVFVPFNEWRQYIEDHNL